MLSGGTTGTSDVTILTTEHFTLQSARQLCLQDMQNRATIFMTGLSASLVAISFFGSATQFRGGFVAFVLALLVPLWVAGVLTWMRVVQAAIEDVIISFGIARIHHRYTEIAPNLSTLLVRSIHDDYAGIDREMGSPGAWWQKLMPTYVSISFITSVLAGAVIAFVLNEISRSTLTIQMVGGVAAFGINMLFFRQLSSKLWSNVDRLFPSLYPSPKVAPAREAASN